MCHSAEDARATSRRLVAASDKRRRNVERVLHDGVQQHLALLGLKLSMLERTIGTDQSHAQVMCGELREEIQGALQELRQVAHLMYPTILENEGLGAALRTAARRYVVPTRVETDPGRLPAEVENAIYFCCLEALDNAAKHAGADAAVTVRVAVEGDQATFTVDDDGVGFDPADSADREGLQHIADRLAAVGGTLEVVSSPGTGTHVAGAVPLTIA